LLQRTPQNVEFSCATIKVPQDWGTAPDGVASGGKTFDLALVRARATGQRNRVGSVVVNPGGPGASGVDLAVYLSTSLPTALTKRFDVVGFDPRGVGRSTPVSCFSDHDLDEYFGGDPDPVSPEAFQATVSLQGKMARACGDKYGDSLRLFSTEQAARDLDAIRAAVGDDKLSYLGFSYGTLLGAVYAQLFAPRVRAMVLDGAVDPTLSSVESAESQARGFERAFDNFSAWCQTSSAQCPIAPDPRTVVTDLMLAARDNPVGAGSGRKATPGWIFHSVVSSLYNQSGWHQLAVAIGSLRDGNASGVFALADQYADRDPTGRYSNLFDANAAVNCADDDQTPGVERLRQFQQELRAKYPLFGAPIALNLVCAQWPGQRDPYPTGAAAGSPPILVVGTTGDPATPYEQAGRLASMLEVGTVLTWQGEGHTAYPRTRCVAETVNAYLIDLKVPEPNASCPPE
jgi:pimeloyl-ACP methyl ester carboxylesterase